MGRVPPPRVLLFNSNLNELYCDIHKFVVKYHDGHSYTPVEDHLGNELQNALGSLPDTFCGSFNDSSHLSRLIHSLRN